MRVDSVLADEAQPHQPPLLVQGRGIDHNWSKIYVEASWNIVIRHRHAAERVVQRPNRAKHGVRGMLTRVNAVVGEKSKATEASNASCSGYNRRRIDTGQTGGHCSQIWGAGQPRLACKALLRGRHWPASGTCVTLEPVLHTEVTWLCLVSAHSKQW